MGRKTYKATIPPGSDQAPVQDDSVYGVPDGVELVVVHFSGVTNVSVSNTTRVIGWCVEDPESNAEFINLPIGTVMFDTTNGKMYLKTAAAGTNTWVAFTGS